MKLILGDAVEELPKIKDKSIDLVVIDPPYNIGKAEWDIIDNYTEWLGGIFEELDRVLKDNGSFYFFHNDFPQMAKLQLYIEENTEFKFRRLITWNKVFKGSTIEDFAQYHMSVKRLRNYLAFSEFCLFYTKQEGGGHSEIVLNVENFIELRNYFKRVQQYIGKNISQINKILGHRRAEHAFYHSTTQWHLPTKETYRELIERFNIDYMEGFRDWEDLKEEYDELREQYESQRYTFNNQKTHHSVWNYNVAEKRGHITPKPVPLIENILKHSSNEGDVVLDCFMGSGTTGVAAKNLNRRFIGIEKDEEYFNLAKERIGKNDN